MEIDNIDYSIYKEELQKKGYTVIPNVYTKEEIDEYRNLFFEWYNSCLLYTSDAADE